MVSITDFRKSIRFEHQSTVKLTDNNSDYFAYVRMLDFSSGGLYFLSDIAFK